MVLAFVIFLVTLFLVIYQPKSLPIGWSALGGALAAFLCGLISVSDIATVWQIIWNATGAFVAIILISMILDEAGSFEWAALHVARLGRGRGKQLFVFSILLGAIVAAVFANDGAALILTPIIVAMLLALGYQGKAIIAFVMASGFIADMGSLPLMVSNLVNIVSADFFHLSFAIYLKNMLPVAIVSVFSTLLALFLYYQADLPERYDFQKLPEPISVVKDKNVFGAGWLVLAALLCGFFILEPMGVPVSFTAFTAALLLALFAGRSKQIAMKKIFISAPWQVVLFSLGMYLVVYGLKNAGLTQYLTKLLIEFSTFGAWGAALGSGLMAALLSSIMNNMPTVLIEAISISDAKLPENLKELMVYSNIVGCDLGPKLTPIGSLATLLWLHVLKQKGIKISWGYYCKVGAIITFPVLSATLAAMVLFLG
ncbi:arsenic transporter [Acetobacteraceae bacterium]|nr:arsenic transporter [Acetobacteraceae bacterium]